MLTNNGLGPLHLASTHGQLDIAKLLLVKRADVNQRTKVNQNTPLHYTNSLQMMKLLLEHSADPMAINTNGDTPLMWVAATGDSHMVETLLRAGALPEAENHERVSVLACAIDNGDAASTLVIVRALTRTDQSDDPTVEVPLSTRIRNQLKSCLETAVERKLAPVAKVLTDAKAPVSPQLTPKIAALCKSAPTVLSRYLLRTSVRACKHTCAQECLFAVTTAFARSHRQSSEYRISLCVQ
jgi:ankyrin repeat protein